MKRRPRRERTYSYYARWSAMFITVNLAIVFALGSAVFLIARNTVYQNKYEGHKSVVEQFSKSVENQLNTFSRVAMLTARDASVQHYLTLVDAESETLASIEPLRNQVNTWMQLPVENSRVELWLSDSRLPQFYGRQYDYAASIAGMNRNVWIYSLDSVTARFGDEWASVLSAQNAWRQLGEDSRFHCVSWIQPLYNHERILSGDTASALIGYMRIVVRLADILDISAFADMDGATGVFVVSASGQQILSVAQDDMDAYTDRDIFLWYERRIPQTDLSIVVLTTSEILSDVYGSMYIAMVVMALLVLLSSVVFSARLMRRLRDRLERFRLFIASYRAGDFIERPPAKRDDEFTRAEEALVEMSVTIRALLENLEGSYQEKTRTEMEMLQAQINPHFLYNTLSSISTLAQMNRHAEMNQMIAALSDFYRIALSRGEIMIPVEKELEHVSLYVDIRRMQFGRRVQVAMDIADDVLELMTVKVILQPFVENVYQHALREGEDAHILIRAYVHGQALYFTVEDDGCGMTDEAVDRVMRGEAGGYAIRNVHKRIQLQLGESYGVTLQSPAGGGLHVTLRLPVFARVKREE